MQRFKNILPVLNPEVQETAALDKAVSLKPEGFVTPVTLE